MADSTMQPTFLRNLLQHPVGSVKQVQWQSRADGIVEDSDTGASPLLLPMPEEPITSHNNSPGLLESLE